MRHLDIDICLQAASAFADGKLTEINVQKAAGEDIDNEFHHYFYHYGYDIILGFVLFAPG